MLVIYIINLYHQKLSTFYSVQRRNSGKKRRQLLCMRRRQDDVSGLLNLIFCGDVHMIRDPPPPRPHASTKVSPPPCGLHKWMAPWWQPILYSVVQNMNIKQFILGYHPQSVSAKPTGIIKSTTCSCGRLQGPLPLSAGAYS